MRRESESAPSLKLARAGRLERSDGAEDRVAHRSSRRAVERDDGPQLGRQATDALAPASRRQRQPLELSPDVLGLAVAEHQRDATGGFDGSVGFDPGEN